jgi:hypothetical protein
VAPASPQPFSITNWGHKDGLPSTTVHAITQSADGYLWLATGDGLVRFDGFQFVPAQIPDLGQQPLGRVTALFPSGPTGLFLGTSTGRLIRWDGAASHSVSLDSGVDRIQEAPDHTLRVTTRRAVLIVRQGDLSVTPATLPDGGSANGDPAGLHDLPPLQQQRADQTPLYDVPRRATIRTTLHETNESAKSCGEFKK